MRKLAPPLDSVIRLCFAYLRCRRLAGCSIITGMTRRTYENSGEVVERGVELEELVKDKRAGWRATPARGRRRQRRYMNRLIRSSAEYHDDG